VIERDNGEYAKLLGMMIESAADGHSVITATPTHAFDNLHNRAHGGYTASLIDTAMGWAVASKVAKGTQFGTVELSVRYVGKIDEATGPLKITGDVVHAGRTMLTAEARVTNADGKILAHGSGTFLVYPGQ
jgi:uncharacterized protein (TIGR00369 family)